jgi:hypothetical protein
VCVYIYIKGKKIEEKKEKKKVGAQEMPSIVGE